MQVQLLNRMTHNRNHQQDTKYWYRAAPKKLQPDIKHDRYTMIYFYTHLTNPLYIQNTNKYIFGTKQFMLLRRIPPKLHSLACFGSKTHLFKRCPVSRNICGWLEVPTFAQYCLCLIHLGTSEVLLHQSKTYLLLDSLREEHRSIHSHTTRQSFSDLSG